MKVEVAVLGFQTLVMSPYGLCGSNATLEEEREQEREIQP